MKLGIYGFGAIGRLIAREALKRGHELVAIIDIDERLVNRSLSELLGKDLPDLRVSNDPICLKDADVVVHATTSYLDEVFDQLEKVISMGVHVVSTCETLAYPYYRYPDLAEELDRIAKAHRVSVIGSGINPGLLLDTLVITIASASNFIKRIRATRSLDAARRRRSFQRKIGIGLPVEDVRDMLARGELTGHVGYAESVCLIAHAGSLTLSKVIEAQEPIRAERDMRVENLIIKEGENLGIKGYGIGYVNGRPIIEVRLQAYIRALEYEEIIVEGTDYTLKWKSSGTPGDLGTVAVILNIAERLPFLNPGLHLMVDLLPFRIRYKT